MTDEVRTISRVTDENALEFFNSLKENLGFGEPNIKIIGSQETVTADFLKKKESLGFGQAKISHINASITTQTRQQASTPTNITVSIERGQPIPEQHGRHFSAQPSLYIDFIKISSVEHASAELAFKINDFIEQILIARASPPITTFPDSNLRGLVETHHQLITALETKISSIGEKFADARINLENEFQNRRGQLEQAYIDKEEKLKEEFSKAEISLKAESDRLESLQNELDYRDNTPVRREIRHQLKKQLESYKEKFSLTNETRELRRPIHYTIAFSSVSIFCLLLIFIYFGVPSDYTDRILFSIKTAALTFFVGGLIIWYLKWLTKWSDRHADAEFHLKQLELDMDRASWLVETALEWKNSENMPIPPQLLEALSRNLFVETKKEVSNEQSAADHLASAILGEASKIKLNAAGQEIEISRSGIRKLSKTDP